MSERMFSDCGSEHLRAVNLAMNIMNQQASLQTCKSRTLRVKAPFVLFLATFLLAYQSHALPGDLATRMPVNDEDPVKGIPTLEQRNTDPLEFGYFIQDLIARAEGAFEKKDWARSVKYYEALARAVPERAISFSRLCSGYAELGQIDVAAANCGKALQLQGARVYDHFRFVNLTIRKKVLSPAEVLDADASLEHLRTHAARATSATSATSAAPPVASATPSAGATKKTPEQIKTEFLSRRHERLLAEMEGAEGKGSGPELNLPFEVEVLACRMAVRLREEHRIEQCLTALRKLNVDAKLRLPFEWSQAVIQLDRERASTLMEQAKAFGVPPAAIQAMRDEQERIFSEAGPLGVARRFWAVGLVALLAAVAGAAGFWRWTAKRRQLGSPAQA